MKHYFCTSFQLSFIINARTSKNSFKFTLMPDVAEVAYPFGVSNMRLELQVDFDCCRRQQAAADWQLSLRSQSRRRTTWNSEACQLDCVMDFASVIFFLNRIGQDWLFNGQRNWWQLAVACRRSCPIHNYALLLKWQDALLRIIQRNYVINYNVRKQKSVMAIH